MNEIRFVSIDDFPLRWRFTDPKHSDLPPEILRSIRPLSVESSNAVNSAAVARCSGDTDTAVVIHTPADYEAVRPWLLGLPVPSSQVLVSWDAATAVLTDWSLFVAYWDDFCYPSSDDVTIWPLDSDVGWSLCYSHDEDFAFRMPARGS